jgi:hypothetical protein
MRSSAALRRRLLALGVALCGAMSTNAAHATVAEPCGTVHAYVRPGPIHAGQAAVRFVPTDDTTTVDPSLLTLTGADGAELALSVENLADGSAFLRAATDLEPGTYTLTYASACASEPFEVDVEVRAEAADPSVLGELTLAYEPYCVGYHADGTGAPPVTATVALSDGVLPYERFLSLKLTASPDGAWTSGVVPLTESNPLTYSRPSDCTLFSAPDPNERFFIASASIIDGPLLPELVASVDAACADCSAYVGGAGTSGAGAAGELHGTPDRPVDCALSPHTGSQRTELAVLALAGGVGLWRRRRRAFRERLPHARG